MPFLAFYKQPIQELFSMRSGYLLEILKDYQDTEIPNLNEDQKLHILDQCQIKFPQIDLSKIQIEKGSGYLEGVKSEEYTRFNQKFEMGDTRQLHNFIYFKIPFYGESSVFYLRPFEDFPGVIGLEEVTKSYLIIRQITDPYRTPESQLSELTPKIKQILTNIQAVLNQLYPDIEQFNLKLQLQLQDEIAKRQHFVKGRVTIKPQTIQIQTPKNKLLGTIDLSDL